MLNFNKRIFLSDKNHYINNYKNITDNDFSFVLQVSFVKGYTGIIWLYSIIWIILLYLNAIKLEEVVLLQSQYETWNSNQYNHLRDYNSDTCLSRTPHVCDLLEPGYSSLQYGGDEGGRLGSI